jgi:colicin import membrane protein
MTQEISIFKKVETLVPSTIFSQGGIQPILDAIEKEVSQEVPDTSTDKGRKAIASNAAKVSKSKTLLDKMGKELTDKLNLAIKPINAERKLARDTLDALRDRTREPLNKYEADELAAAAAKFQKVQAEKLAVQKENDWEFALMIDEKFDRDLADLKAKAEAERVELEAKELKELEARNLQIAEDAAKAERDKHAQALIDAEYEKQKAKREALQQREDAKALALKVEQDTINAAEAERVRRDKAISDEAQRIIDHVKQAKIDQQKALDEQKAKYESQKVAEKAEADKRQADEDHCRKRNLEAVACFEKGGLSHKDSILAVRLIAANRIDYIDINY